ncbi:MAG: T9SS type A sorting domain-containing protein [Bacteroidales bacterium]|nr:T9SS type A sorting domain-containing protein [Bacteroidales bacterium]
MSGFFKHIILISGIFCNSFISFSQSYCKLSVSTTVTVVDGASFQAGDTICIQPGVRNFLLFRNLIGTAESPITIINVDGKVIIDTDAYYGIKFSGCKYVRMLGNNIVSERYGIFIRRVGNGAGISVDDMSTNVELANIEISYTAIAGIYAKTDPNCNSFVATRDKFTMYDIKIHDCYLHDIQDEGMYIGSTKFTGQYIEACDTTVLPHIIHGVKVYNNIVERTGWDGIQVSSTPTDCEIYGNIVRNDSWRETPNQMSGIIIGGGSVCDCYNNIIMDGIGDGIDIFGSNEMRIFNNLIIRAGRTFYPGDPAYPRHGIFFGNPPDGSFASLAIIFNTIIQPKTTGIRFFNENTTGNLIHNNIVCEPGAFADNGNDAYFNHNLQSSQFTLSDNYFTNDIGTVHFVDIQSDIYDLKANSPAINKAIDLGYSGVLFDIENRSRPFNAGFDIGAYECHEVDAGIDAKNEIGDCLLLFPNPASESVSFSTKYPVNEDYSISLINMYGQYLIPNQVTLNLDNNRFYVNIAGFKKGFYIIRFFSANYQGSGKLFINNE